MNSTDTTHSPSKLLRNVVVVDVETTGLDPERHSIVQIGAVAFIEDGAATMGFTKDCAPWRGAAIDPEAMAVHGMTVEDFESLAGMHKFEGDAVFDLMFWLRQEVGADRVFLCGVNVGKFDATFLRAAAKRAGIEKEWNKLVGHRTLELNSVAWACRVAKLLTPAHEASDSGGIWSADQLFQALGMEAEPRPHQAITGATMEAKALEMMVERLAVSPSDQSVPSGGQPGVSPSLAQATVRPLPPCEGPGEMPDVFCSRCVFQSFSCREAFRVVGEEIVCTDCLIKAGVQL